MYLTEAYLQANLGTTKVAKLAPGGTKPTVAGLIGQASALLEGALRVGGYTGAYPRTVFDGLQTPEAARGATECPELITLATFGAWVALAYGANDLEVPERYDGHLQIIDDLREGKLELDGITRSIVRAPGGIASTSADPCVQGSRPPVFPRSRKNGSNPMRGY